MPFIDNLLRSIFSILPTELTHGLLMPKYDYNLISHRYSDRVFLIDQITKQHLKSNHAWNHINEHPNVANYIISRQKEKKFSELF